MSYDDPRGIIELGNINIKCIIFNINNDNFSEILSYSVKQSEGFHNGKIIDLGKASNAIRLCIAAAEKKAKVILKKISVVIEQTDFLCTKFSKYKKIYGSRIHKEDIDFLLKEAKKHVTLNDESQSIIHIFNHNYIVDGKKFIEEPIDIYANYLSHEMTFVTMQKNDQKKINEAFIECDIEVERLISSIFALGISVLNSDQLKKGSILINIGFEKTSIGLFNNLALINSITLPIGENHLIKDISKVCSLSMKESEIIKNKIDFSFISNDQLFDNNNYLKKFFFSESDYRKISKSLILDIIKNRLDEILEIIKKQIILTGLNSKPGKNVFLNEESSNLFNLKEYFSNYLGEKVINLDLIDKNNKTSIPDKNFATCLGALKLIKDGWETEAIPKLSKGNDAKISFFSKLFGNS